MTFDRDAWAAIDASQAREVRDAEERRRRWEARALRVLPDPAPEALRPSESVEEPGSATSVRPDPSDAPVPPTWLEPRYPAHPPVDVVTGIRLYARHLRELVRRDGPIE